MGGSYAGRRAGVVLGASIGAMGGLAGFGGARAVTHAISTNERILDRRNALKSDGTGQLHLLPSDALAARESLARAQGLEAIKMGSQMQLQHLRLAEWRSTLPSPLALLLLTT